MTDIDRNRLAELLAVAQGAQTAYWESLSDLEDLLGAEVDGCRDLSEIDVDGLIELAEEEDEA